MTESPIHPQLSFDLSAYRFHLQCDAELAISRFFGNTLRGGFGKALKRSVCVVRHTPCQKCSLVERCIYPMAFDVSAPTDYGWLPKGGAPPRPFVFDQPLTHQQVYQPGESLAFQFTLVGRMIQHLPHFVFALLRLGERYGLGAERVKYTLNAIDAITPNTTECVYTDVSQFLKPPTVGWTWAAMEASVASWSSESLEIEFVTPTKLIYRGKMVWLKGLRFELLMRAILRRASMLAEYFCGQRWELDYPSLLKATEAVSLTVTDGGWWSRKRYSRTQRQRMPMEGFVGRVKLSGNLTPFLPFLKLGEWLHVGKHTTFGFGQYRVIPSPK